MVYIEWLASLIECYIMVRFVYRWLPVKRSGYDKPAVVVLFLLLAVDNIALSQKDGFENISVILLLLLIFVFSLMFQHGRIYEKIFVTLIPTLTMLPINAIVLHSMSLITSESLEELRSAGGDLRILVLFFSKFVFFIVCEIIIKLRKKDTGSLLSFQWMLQLICFAISFFIANVVWKISKQASLDNHVVLWVFLMIAILNILLFILLDKMENNSRLKEQYKLSEMNLENQKQFVLNAQKKYEDIKVLNHDMKHYLTTATTLISSGKSDEAQNYLENLLQKKVSGSVGTVQTGILAVDSVVNEKLSICKEKGISAKCLIDAEFGGIDEMDMSILLSNLLDNAINGSAGVEKPILELEICRKKAYVVVTVRNSINGSVLANNPDLVTTNPEKTVHGYGIISIHNISDKYDGTVEFREEDEFFVAEVWLNQESQV